MRSSDKKPEANRHKVRTIKSGGGKTGSGDLDSTQLKAIGKGLGNSEFDKQLSSGNGQRDVLLAHVCERLKTIHGAQNKELQAMGREREWFKQVAKGTDGYHLPDPTRWHECAQLFQRAAEALCNGNLGRGAQLLERATEVEEAVFESVPTMVKEDLEKHECAQAAPDEMFHINDEAGCSTRDKPQDLKYAEKILAVRDKMESTPPLPIRNRMWWEEKEEEEEEEEEEEDDG